MATFVLVPGAWLGGWCWQRVTPLLRAAGHEVWTPTLTGLGEREHLGTRETGLATHTEDIVKVLEFEDLRDVRLLGHSYAGLVVGGVAGRAPERVRELIYLASPLPAGGKSLFDEGGPEYREFVEIQARAAGDGWRWPLPSFEEIEQYSSKHGLSAEDQAWFRSKAVGHPVRSFDDGVDLEGDTLERLPKTYIYCTGDLFDAPAEVRGPGWRYRELDTGHWPMFTRPDELAQLLSETLS